MHHSDLGSGDGILIGASLLQQLEDNLRCLCKEKYLQGGKLSKCVVDDLRRRGGLSWLIKRTSRINIGDPTRQT
jgi:hypothetical protein